MKEIKEFLLSNNLDLFIPIVRNRTSPNTFFITVGNKEVLKKKNFFLIYKMFEKGVNEKVELITV